MGGGRQLLLADDGGNLSSVRGFFGAVPRETQAHCPSLGGPHLEKIQLQRIMPIIELAACGLVVLYGLAVFHLPLNGPIVGTIAKLFNVQSNTTLPIDRRFYDSAGWTMGYATIGQIPTAEDVS